MAVTIKDVAGAAQVSTATVSHVLNETRYVSEETRRKVYDAVRELGYVPNMNAAGLRNGKTKRIALLVPAIGSFFSIDILESVEQVFRKEGYQVIIGCSREDLRCERDQVDVFNYQQVDGMLMFPAPGDHSYLNQMPRKYPIVFIDRSAENCQRDLFIGDNEQAVYELVKQMIAAGHRSIGLINGVEGVSVMAERIRGYRRALEEADIPFDETLIRNGNSQSEGGYRAAEWFVQDGRVTAILSLTATMTLGCMKYLTLHKVPVPQRIAVVGFGETEWAEITQPPLTTLRHPLFEMGRRAAERLIMRIKEAESGAKPEPYETVRMPIELVRRETF